MAYIGLGSNLAGSLSSPAQQVSTAMQELDNIEQSRRVACSSLYRSAPMGPRDQPDYINAVVSIETGLDAADLLTELQAIEQAHDRERTQRWGARTLDLDLLLFADVELDTDSLTIPHPGLCEREFVVYPLLEIAPDLAIPARGKLSDIAASCPKRDLEKLGEIA